MTNERKVQLFDFVGRRPKLSMRVGFNADGTPFVRIETPVGAVTALTFEEAVDRLAEGQMDSVEQQAFCVTLVRAGLGLYLLCDAPDEVALRKALQCRFGRLWGFIYPHADFEWQVTEYGLQAAGRLRVSSDGDVDDLEIFIADEHLLDKI